MENRIFSYDRWKIFRSYGKKFFLHCLFPIAHIALYTPKRHQAERMKRIFSQLHKITSYTVLVLHTLVPMLLQFFYVILKRSFYLLNLFSDQSHLHFSFRALLMQLLQMVPYHPHQYIEAVHQNTTLE